MTSVFRTDRSFESGLGLVSLMLVILSLSLAAVTVMAVIAPSLATRQRLSTEEKGRALRLALDRFHTDLGSWPSEDLQEFFHYPDAELCTLDLDGTPPFLHGWCGPYLEPLTVNDSSAFDYGMEFQLDGWGSRFSYDSTSGALSSCGPDRICPTGDDIAF